MSERLQALAAAIEKPFRRMRPPQIVALVFLALVLTGGLLYADHYLTGKMTTDDDFDSLSASDLHQTATEADGRLEREERFSEALSGLEEQLNALTGCDQHQKLGESADGAYSYYLSSNSKGDAGLEAELENIEVTLKDMVNMEEGLSFFSALPQSISGSVGEFSTTDIQGTAVDQTIFQEHTLTLVNVFTTWCSPCVEEIPELEKLRADMAEQGVGVIGIVMDTRNEAGEQDSEALQKAQILAERSGAQFPFLIPDETALHGLLDSIDTVPQTFFVDRQGNIVGETYLGGHTYDEWKAIVEQELGRLGGDA